MSEKKTAPYRIKLDKTKKEIQSSNIEPSSVRDALEDLIEIIYIMSNHVADTQMKILDIQNRMKLELLRQEEPKP